MNELKVFQNEEFGAVRTTIINGEPYFLGKDVADILGYTNTPKAIRDHIDDEDKLTERIVLSGQNREVIFINESGLYSLILSSKLPTAKCFKRWVTSEILPSIRKTGSYTDHSNPQQDGFAQRELTIRELEARAKVADVLYKLLDVETLSPTYKNIIVCKTAEAACGTPVLPLPKTERLTYSAAEIGKMLGISGQKVGRLANLNGLKTDEYGAWYHDKAVHSNKEIDTFRYYDNAVDKFREIMQGTEMPDV